MLQKKEKREGLINNNTAKGLIEDTYNNVYISNRMFNNRTRKKGSVPSEPKVWELKRTLDKSVS